MNYIIRSQAEKELYHHGVLGMRWGVRRYQNKDGSLTAKGKKHRDKTIKELEEQSRSTKEQAKSIKNTMKAQEKMRSEAVKDLPLGEKSPVAKGMRLDINAGKRAVMKLEMMSDIYDQTIKAYKSNEIEIGKDYYRSFLKNEFMLTESGQKKEGEILDRVEKDHTKKNKKELDRINKEMLEDYGIITKDKKGRVTKVSVSY